jgi:hypothetical protein
MMSGATGAVVTAPVDIRTALQRCSSADDAPRVASVSLGLLLRGSGCERRDPVSVCEHVDVNDVAFVDEHVPHHPGSVVHDPRDPD